MIPQMPPKMPSENAKISRAPSCVQRLAVYMSEPASLPLVQHGQYQFIKRLRAALSDLNRDEEEKEYPGWDRNHIEKVEKTKKRRREE
jgi:hypothetical protein